MDRAKEIIEKYTALIDRHLDDLVHNRCTEMLEIEDFAAQIGIHPIHLTNTVKNVCGTSACGLYQPRILEKAKELLKDPSLSAKDISLILTFEPSQFTKWFKKFSGVTPKQYRAEIKQVHLKS